MEINETQSFNRKHINSEQVIKTTKIKQIVDKMYSIFPYEKVIENL
jgi:hypothetical protein